MQVLRPSIVITAIAAGAGLIVYQIDRPLGLLLGVGIPLLAIGVAMFGVCVRATARRRVTDANA